MEHAIPTPVPKDRKKKKSISSQGDKNDSVGSSPGEGETEVEVTEKIRLPPRKPSAMEVIKEILDPTLKIPESSGPYEVPDAVSPDNLDAIKDLDEQKIIELKELFTLLDSDADGQISEKDLRVTFSALGKAPPEGHIQQMMSEAHQPLNFDAFVALMGYRTIELDPEDVLIEAFSKWDLDGTGLISEERIFHDLITYGDRFTEREAEIALEEAPLGKQKTFSEQPMIDYGAFCKVLSGLRKRKK